MASSLFRTLRRLALPEVRRCRAPVLALCGGAGLVWANLKAAAANAESTYVVEEKKESGKWRLRHRVIGNYENRIRQMSNPKKVFEYFASQTDDEGNLLMTPFDFVRAITRFGDREMDLVGTIKQNSAGDKCSTPTIMPKKGHSAPTEWRNKIPKIFRSISRNQDGLLRMEEYILITTLLALPTSTFDMAFRMVDMNSDGVLGAEEWKQVMANLYKNSPISSALKPRPKDLRDIVPAPKAIFGEDFKQTINLVEFRTLLTSLRREVWRFQFRMWDEDGDDTISAVDYASHIISHANKDHSRFERRKNLLRSRDTKDATAADLTARRYDWKDFYTFNRIVDSADDLNRALKLIDTAGYKCDQFELKRLVQLVSGETLSQNNIDLMFFLFDEDQDGYLDQEEFVSALLSTSSQGLNAHRDFGLTRYNECYRKCMRGDPAEKK